MLGIDFKAPVDVTITFDDSDNDEIKDIKKEIITEDISNSTDSEKIINKNITQQDNKKNKEISQNVEKGQDSNKNDNAVSCNSTAASKKRKLEKSPPVDTTVENSFKHTVITNTHGQTHIIVAPPTDTNTAADDDTKKTNQYLDNSLKTISEHLILIMQAYQQFSTIEKNSNGLETEPWNHFLAIKNYFFNLSYSAVISIIVPQENDMLFVTRFLKDTLRLYREKNTVNKITNEQQIFPFYSEMLEWAKRKKSQLPEIHQKIFTDKASQKRSHLNSNTSDNRNPHLLNLLTSVKTRTSPGVPDFPKNSAITCCNTNISNICHPPNGQGNTPSQTNPSFALSASNCSHSVVPPINSTVTSTFPSHQTYGLANYNNFSVQTTSDTNDTMRQNQYQQVQNRLSQMTPSGLNLAQQSQGSTRVTPLAQNSNQRTQYNSSQMKHNSQNPYLHMQHGLAQAGFRGIQTQFNPRSTNAGLVAQSHIRDKNGLNQPTGNFVPVPQANYIQSRTEQQMQATAPVKQPPSYDIWQKNQEQKQLTIEQQLTDAALAQTRMPLVQWQHQQQQPTNTAPWQKRTPLVQWQHQPQQPTDVAPVQRRSPLGQWHHQPQQPTDVAPVQRGPPLSQYQPQQPTDVAPVQRRTPLGQYQPQQPKDVAPVQRRTPLVQWQHQPQQPTDAAPVQRRTPLVQWQHQPEPQPHEVTRSVSTDSGIVSPLPYINTTDATTNSYPIEEEQPAPYITHVTSLNPNVSYNNESECSVCFKITKLKCLCLEKYYCSYDCQESDWNNHSMICSTQKKQDQITH